MVLAHIADKSDEYCRLFKANDKPTLLDNGAFENRMPYPVDEMIRLGHKVGADILVIPDFPYQDWSVGWKTADIELQTYRDNGFKTMFVPQSLEGDVMGLYKSIERAIEHPLVDYIGLSILACPNAHVRREVILERYQNWSACKKRFHMLGALDSWGDELSDVAPYEHMIESWDSSAAVWAGVHDELIFTRDEKFTKPVDFLGSYFWTAAIDTNIDYMEFTNG